MALLRAGVVDDAGDDVLHFLGDGLQAGLVEEAQEFGRLQGGHFHSAVFFVDGDAARERRRDRHVGIEDPFGLGGLADLENAALAVEVYAFIRHLRFQVVNAEYAEVIGGGRLFDAFGHFIHCACRFFCIHHGCYSLPVHGC